MSTAPESLRGRVSSRPLVANAAGSSNRGITVGRPRPFHLVRHEDPSGVSGTGVVAEGAVWSSGSVALHWPGHPRATSVWASLDDLLAAHGHGGSTEIRWLADR